MRFTLFSIKLVEKLLQVILHLLVLLEKLALNGPQILEFPTLIHKQLSHTIIVNRKAVFLQSKSMFYP